MTFLFFTRFTSSLCKLRNLFNLSIKNIKQTLINNDFSNQIIDEQIKRPLNISTLIAMEIILHQTTLSTLNYFP